METKSVEKEKVVDLLGKINQKKKELKQLGL